MKWMTRSMVFSRVVLPARWDIYSGVHAQGETITIKAPSPMDAGRLCPGDHHLNSNEPPWSPTTMAHTPGTAARHRVDFAFRFCRVHLTRAHGSRLGHRHPTPRRAAESGCGTQRFEVVADGERTKPVQRINPKVAARSSPRSTMKTCSFKPRSIHERAVHGYNVRGEV